MGRGSTASSVLYGEAPRRSRTLNSDGLQGVLLRVQPDHSKLGFEDGFTEQVVWSSYSGGEGWLVRQVALPDALLGDSGRAWSDQKTRPVESLLEMILSAHEGRIHQIVQSCQFQINHEARTVQVDPNEVFSLDKLAAVEQLAPPSEGAFWARPGEGLQISADAPFLLRVGAGPGMMQLLGICLGEDPSRRSV